MRAARTDEEVLKAILSNVRRKLAELGEAIDEISEAVATPWTAARLEDHVSNLRSEHVKLTRLRSIPAVERDILVPLLAAEALSQKKYEQQLRKTPYELRAALIAWSKTCKRYGVDDPILRSGTPHRDGRRFSLSPQARAVLQGAG